MKINYNKKNTIPATLLFFLVIFLLFSGCDNAQKATTVNNKLIPSVEAVQARYGSLPLIERLNGVVRAKNQVEIYPEVNAIITDVKVHDGNVVGKGDTLIQLRDRDFQERLKQAQANYRIARAQSRQAEARLKDKQTQLKRIEKLAEKELVSPAELEQVQTEAISAEADLELARARVAQARASVEERESELSETAIRAPITGSVGNRNAEIGMLVNPGNRLFTMGQLDSLKVEVILTDRMLQYIDIGQRSEIIADILPSGKKDAPLSRISPFLHPVTHSTRGEIDMSNKNGNLKPGMFVVVDIFYGESDNATLVPLSALYENPETGETGVFVSSDSIIINSEPTGNTDDDRSISLSEPVSFKFVPVDVIAKGRMQAGISAVKPGDWVVTLGQNLLGSQGGNACVHTTEWNYVEYLQKLQSQDLLKDIMEKQQKLSKNDLQINN